MRRAALILTAAAALALSSCGGGNTAGQADGYYMASREDSVSAQTGTRSLQTIEAQLDTAYAGRRFHSYVVRRADESLPTVTDDDGNRYLDNRITLRLTSGQEKVLERDFLKTDFAKYLDSTFLKNSILEGLTFDRIVAGGLQYAASVSYPESDLYVPFNVLVTPRGSVSISKADMLDDGVPGDTLSSGRPQ